MLQLEFIILFYDTMIDDLRPLAIFAKVVQAGSFRAAAHLLELSPSVISHHITELEKRLGVALLYRSTRKLSLTFEGERLFAQANAMLIAAETGLNHIAHQATEPSGKLHVTLPAMFARSPFLKDIADFARTYSKVSLQMNFSDSVQDIIREGIDIAIRIGNLKDSSLKAKRLYHMQRSLVAAPSYLKSKKLIRKPQDLIGLDWIGLKMRPNTKQLLSESGRGFTIDFNPRIVADSMEAVCQLSIAGLGLATPPTFLVEEDLLQERLARPLSSWSPEPIPVYAVWPNNVSKESLTYKLLTYLDRHSSIHQQPDA